MKLLKYILSVLFLIILSACTSYELIESEIVNGSEVINNQRVYIENPKLDREFKILKKSNLFEITEDSSNPTKVRLLPVNETLNCGNPLMGTCLTFGLLSSSIVDSYIFSFDEIKENTTTNYELLLLIKMHFSIWAIFESGSLDQQITKGITEAYKVSN